MRDEVGAHSRRAGAWGSRWPRCVLESCFDRCTSVAAGAVADAGAQLAATGLSRELVVHSLCSADSTAVRLGAIDEIAPVHIEALQYVDDILAPASSWKQFSELCRG